MGYPIIKLITIVSPIQMCKASDKFDFCVFRKKIT